MPSSIISLRLAVIALNVLLLIVSPAACRAADDVKQEMTAAIAAVRPALIRIIVVAADYRQGREMKMESAGSGVIISPEGYAVTNHHVAMNALHMVCTLSDKREVEATLVGTDALSDIAVIKLASPDGSPFPTAGFGDSSTLEIGDRVFAMGSPLALSQSVTMGIVSNTEMMMPEDFPAPALRLEGEDVGSIVRWVGHDALIEPGNSGGPLVNREGKIVGINEISFGLAGAIPSNLARRVAEQLIRQGKVSRSWIGLEAQPLLESSGFSKGILVSTVLENSPAAKAGIEPGDILLSLNGTEVTALFKEQIPLFNQFVADIPVGRQIEARVNRGGVEKTFSMTTTERQKAIDREHELKSWGMCATNITQPMRQEMQLTSAEGVIVTGVLPSGPSGSAKPPLRSNDVIQRVNDKPVTDVSGLRAVTQELTEGRSDTVAVVVSFKRGEKQYVTVVKLGKKETSAPGAEISKAWLPVDLQVLTADMAEALGVKGSTGVRVTQVFPTGSKAKTDLQVGDLIVKLDNDDVPADQVGDEEVLPSLIRQYDIGAEVNLAVIREGKPVSVNVVLGACPKSARDYPRYEDASLEFSARDIAFSDRADGKVEEDQNGVLVESITDGGSAALGKLCSGDVISSIDGAPIQSLAELKKKMTEVSSAKPKVMVLKVRRGIRTIFLEIKPDWNDLVK